MTAPAKIAVIIPCFNAERYIVAAVRSVLAQDWPYLEVIVVDDGSSDRSTERVRDIFPDVTLLQQTNQGVAAARNLGIRHSQGDWIAFLDADDIWLPGKLQAQWQLLSAQSTARMAYSAWQVWSSAEPFPSPAYIDEVLRQSDDLHRWAGPSGWIYHQLLLDCAVWTSTVLAHRSLFEEVGVFDTTLCVGEDYDLWLRASRVTQILKVSRPYALYRKHPASATAAAPATNYKDLVVSRALERWGYGYPDGSSVRRADVNRGLAQSWVDFAGTHLGAGNLGRAWYGGLRSLHADLGYLKGWTMLAKILARSLAVGRWNRG
ncbi:MAG: glycosyltransferase family A protein [Candidatus Competibacteraceae bacterium]